MQRIRALILLLPCLFTSLLTGCQKSDLPIRDGMVLASGVVLRNGSPLPHGRISFINSEIPPGAARDEGVAFSSVSDGRFEVEIAPGEYRIEVHQFETPPNAELTGQQSVQVIPERFNKESQLRATISDQGQNSLKIELNDFDGQ